MPSVCCHTPSLGLSFATWARLVPAQHGGVPVRPLRGARPAQSARTDRHSQQHHGARRGAAGGARGAGSLHPLCLWDSDTLHGLQDFKILRRSQKHPGCLGRELPQRGPGALYGVGVLRTPEPVSSRPACGRGTFLFGLLRPGTRETRCPSSQLSTCGRPIRREGLFHRLPQHSPANPPRTPT